MIRHTNAIIANLIDSRKTTKRSISQATHPAPSEAKAAKLFKRQLVLAAVLFDDM
jgi:hypothetical protein